MEIRDHGHVVGIDRIAVLAALNIAYDMLVLKKQKQAYIDGLSERIFELQEKIEMVLNGETQNA
jgi:cell division protein ZapA